MISMDVSMFEQFVSPLALAAAFAIGYVVKNAIPNDAINRFIPLICAVTGVVIVCWASGTLGAESVVAGLVSGLGATGLYQAYKGVIKDGGNGIDESEGE